MPLILIGLAVIGFGILLWGLRVAVHHYIHHKAQHVTIVERDPLLVDLRVGKPTIVYFTAPNCGPCRTTQKPILQQLEQEQGDNIQILTINIEERLDDAMRWGVMKVPRTFVLDYNLRTYASNMSVATLATLQRQLVEAEAAVNTPLEGIKFVNS